MTISQPLLAPAGKGVGSIALSANGTGYIGRPIVYLTGGSGSGATAVANFDPATGIVDGITITNPGSGYLAEDTITVTLSGGGGMFSGTATPLLTDNTSGGLTKSNTGTLIFTGTTASTYSGLTTVSNGELHLNKTAGVDAIAGNISIGGGTLKWLASNQVNNGSAITMTTGTLSLNGQTETITSFNNSGGTFTTGAGTLIGTGATITWSGGTNTINNGGSVQDGHIVISGGTNTVQGGASGGLLQLNSGGTGLEMSGGATLTLNSDATVAGKLKLSGNVSSSGDSTVAIANSGTATNKGTIDLDASTRAFTVANGAAATDMAISAGIANGGLSKEGAGTLELSGINTYTGATSVNGGTLVLAGVANANTSDIAITNSANLTFAATDTKTFTKAITGTAGNITFNVAGNTTDSGGSSTTNFTFGNTGSFTGNIVVNTGLVLPSSNTAFGDSANVIKLNAASGASAGLLVSGAGSREINNAIELVTAGGNGIFRAYTSYGLTLGGVISGAGNLVKTDGGTVTLTNANTYTGATMINSGTLKISAANNLGDATQVTNSISLGLATLQSTANSYDLGTNRSIALTGAGTIQVDAGALTVSGNVSGSNSLTKSGAGTLILSGSNSYSGETIIGNGTIKVDSASGLGTTSRVRFTSGTGILNNNTGSLITIAGLASNTNSSAQQVTGGELLVTGLAENVQNTGYGGWTFNNTKTTLEGGVYLSYDSNRDFTINGTAEVIVSGNVVQGGTGSRLVVNNSGTGSLTLSGASNTHTGGVLLNTGKLNVNSPTAFGTSAGTFTINNGTTLNNTSGSAITIANNNPVTINGNFVFTGSNDLNLGTGAVALGGASRTITANARNLTLGGVISASGAYGLTKAGTGTLTLSGDNTYTGATNVNEGILVINGSQSTAAGTVTVASGATLKGTGMVGGATIIQNGGTLNAGAHANNSPDPLAPISSKQTFSNNLTLESQSIFAWDLSGEFETGAGNRGTKYDAVDVGGNLSVHVADTDPSLPEGITPTPASDAIFRVVVASGFDFNTVFWEQTRTWSDIFQVTGTTSGWAAGTAVGVYNYDFANNTHTQNNPTTYGSFSINNKTLTWTAVPEPTSALAGLLITAGLLRRRRC